MTIAITIDMKDFSRLVCGGSTFTVPSASTYVPDKELMIKVTGEEKHELGKRHTMYATIESVLVSEFGPDFMKLKVKKIGGSLPKIKLEKPVSNSTTVYFSEDIPFFEVTYVENGNRINPEPYQFIAVDNRPEDAEINQIYKFYMITGVSKKVTNSANVDKLTLGVDSSEYQSIENLFENYINEVR